MPWCDVVGVDSCRLVRLYFGIFDSGTQVHSAY